MECEFCRIAQRQDAALVHDADGLIVIADHRPIRPGHVQIIPRAHYPYFDDLPGDLAAAILHLGQRVARAQKRLYDVERVGFVFTGNDVAHVHAHLIPLHAADDVTSARYTDGTAVRVDEAIQRRTALELRHALEGHDD